MSSLENAPKWLNKTAKEYWKRITPSLLQEGILTEATADLIASACAAYSTYREAHEQLETEGRIIVTPSGTVKVNPHVQIEKQAFEQLVRVFKELGIGRKPEIDPLTIDPEEFT